MSIEQDVVELFVRKEKRERLLALAAKASRRRDFVDALLHDRRNLDAKMLSPLEPHALTVGAIVAQVGAAKDDAACIGGLRDGEKAMLIDLLTTQALRARDVLVFDLVTRRAYYENHEGECFVLRGRS